MTDAKFSDTTGNPIKKDLAYMVDVYSYGNGTHLKFDTEFNEQLKALVSLAIQHGVKYTKWNKDSKAFQEVETNGPN